MSGIEVAGIVLAVIPLFISAAEHWKEGLHAGKRAIKMTIFLEDYTRQLRAQSALLICYLKDVIGRTPLSAEIQRELVKDPVGERWTDPEIVKVISEELGDAHQPFMDTLHTICKVLTKQIKAEVGQYLSKTDQSADIGLLHVLSQEKGQFNLQTRLKFSWRSPERSALLRELKDCGDLLGQLSRAAERAEPYKRRQRLHQVQAVDYEWRNDVQRLLGIICKCCKCQSCSMHELSLRLQKFADGDSELEIGMMLYNSSDKYCEFSIIVERASVNQVKRIPGMRFLPQGPLAVTNPIPRFPKIEIQGDICQEVRSANSRNVGLQLFLTESEKLVARPLEATSTRIEKAEPEGMLTLDDVMLRLKPFRQKKWLRKEKALLAVVLADSLLQLSPSPWSQICWNSQTFSFKNAGSRYLNSPDYQFKLRRPYTVRHPVSKIQTLDPDHGSSLRKNAQIHALGILLLELYLNRSIEEAAADEMLLSPLTTNTSSSLEDPSTNIHHRRSLAQDVLQEHADDDDMTPQYYEAVRFCLSPRPNPDSRSFSFEDVGFREIFYREVVANLEASLRERWEVSDKVWKEV